MTFKDQISSVVRLLQEARRPIFIWGSGVRQYKDSATLLARSLGIPVVCTWGCIDCINHDDPLMAGGFGTHGTRAANFSVQNSDLIISIGSRLDTKATGQPKDFARGASLVMVDIDPAEIQKFSKLGRKIDIGICADAGEFIEAMLEATKLQVNDFSSWRAQIKKWREKYDEPKVTWPGVNPYQFVKELAKWTTKDDVIVSDTGTALGYLMQAFPFKGERFLHAFNMTPMGYGVPASIGAAFATGRRIVCVTGDGSLMMSVAELATVARWNLNIKIILLNNGGHAMCRQTERQWFGGKHVSTDVESGLAFPNWHQVFPSFGTALTPMHVAADLEELFNIRMFSALILNIHPDAYLIPQARFGAPIEDQEPLLNREEFRQQMIVDPL